MKKFKNKNNNNDNAVLIKYASFAVRAVEVFLLADGAQGARVNG